MNFCQKVVRSFIAIELPKTVKSALAELQIEFKKCGTDVRWVKPDNIHLTLKFLGSIDEKNVDNIVEIIKEICNRYNMFTLEVKGIGVFPNIRSPRVLWVSINGNSVLAELQREIEDGMASLGFESESRRFTPHLTLGRFRSSIGKEGFLEAIKLHGKDSFGSINVKYISLMRSDLNPAGAQHTKITEVPLIYKSQSSQKSSLSY